ncbi:hypothetical protein [Acidipropionibacterium jensenii]|uniref:hypothetical protein n=1 Tax=Acidipropionibacterium jensenii TaxID=1749 RepID=UPI0012AC6A63|nr:hypothetical protein [Acidipropionibacterium jensenii]
MALSAAAASRASRSISAWSFVGFGGDLGIGGHAFDLVLDAGADGIGDRDSSQPREHGELGVLVVFQADGERLHDGVPPSSGLAPSLVGWPISSGWCSR